MTVMGAELSPANEVELAASCGDPGVERFGCRATESFESLHIRIPLKFCQNSGKFWIYQNSSEILKIWGNLNSMSTFSRIFREIPRKFHPNWCKFRWKLSKNKDFGRNSNENAKKFNGFLRRFWIWSGATDCKSCRSPKKTALKVT